MQDSSPQYATPLGFDVHTPVAWRFTLLILHAAAAAAIAICGLLLPFKLAAVAVIGACAWAALVRARTPAELTWFEHDRWVLVDEDGTHRVRLRADTVATRRFCVLIFAADDGAWRRSFVVTPGSLRPAVYRRLIVRLRLSGGRLGGSYWR